MPGSCQCVVNPAFWSEFRCVLLRLLAAQGLESSCLCGLFQSGLKVLSAGTPSCEWGKRCRVRRSAGVHTCDTGQSIQANHSMTSRTQGLGTVRRSSGQTANLARLRVTRNANRVNSLGWHCKGSGGGKKIPQGLARRGSGGGPHARMVGLCYWKRAMSSNSGARPSVEMVEIDAETASQRLDNFLMARLKGVPKSRIYRILRKGEVRVNRSRSGPDYRLQAGDVVRIPPIRVA